MLKFENVANLGQRIRAYDFKPMPDHLKGEYPDRWLEGVVIAKGEVRMPGCAAPLPYRCYAVRVESCSAGQYTKGQTVYVPFETGADYDTRVSLALAPRRANTAQEDEAAGEFPIAPEAAP